MKKRFTKIICGAAALVCTLGVALVTGCSNFYSYKQLSAEKGEIFTADEAEHNGGFAVQKGNYIYFLNGVEGNSAANKFGNPVRGAIYRIAASDYSAHNYSSVDCVVPLVAYTADYSAGIFVYGDRIYYSTPSTARNSDGDVLYDRLDMKSSKLDGTETMKNAYVQFPSTSYSYRYVQVEGTVYLMYVATSETLYDESTGVTNLHSLNTETGEDVVLAYNVSSVVFDETDKTNPRVYYTMNVKNYITGSNYTDYNQLYTVTADATVDKFEGKLSSDVIEGWVDDEDDGELDRYINCGDLVLDGIGGKNVKKTPFNYLPEDESAINVDAYIYSLSTYQNGTLFYTRTDKQSAAYGYSYLFSIKDGALGTETPFEANRDSEDRIQLLSDSTLPAGYKYIFDGEGELEAVLISESGGGITVNYTDENGKLQTEIGYMTDAAEYFYIVKEGTASMLFTDGDYLYYSLSGGNGYSFYRVDYTGTCLDYVGMPVPDGNENYDYTSVQILDLDACTDWYMPELIDGQLLFASETDSAIYVSNYVMSCDLRYYDAASGSYGEVMSNKQIEELNDNYNGIFEIIEKYDEELYANLKGALNYAFFTGEDASAYIEGLAEACNAQVEEGGTPVYSDNTLKKYSEFINPAADNDWKDYTATKNVNGETVYSNVRGYYYGILGERTEEDTESFIEALRLSNLQAWPEEESTGLSAGAVAGICIGSVAFVAAVVAGVLILIRLRNKKNPETAKKKIKVDTTDDKSIDVYGEQDKTTGDGDGSAE